MANTAAAERGLLLREQMRLHPPAREERSDGPPGGEGVLAALAVLAPLRGDGCAFPAELPPLQGCFPAAPAPHKKPPLLCMDMQGGRSPGVNGGPLPPRLPNTPLRQAAERGDLDKVRWLLSQGWSPVWRAPWGDACWHWPLLATPAAPIAAGWLPARALLCEAGGGAPHGGFEMPLTRREEPDYGPVICGSLAEWRAAHPEVRVANLAGRADLRSGDLAPLRGLKAVRLRGCTGLDDAALEHVRGVHTLDIAGVKTFTDAAFVHLRGVHTLDMSGCDQPALTGAAFFQLAGIHTLNMSHCTQTTITSDHFLHLRGVQSLCIWGCTQSTIDDRALPPLRGIHTLDISGCVQFSPMAVARLRVASTPCTLYCMQMPGEVADAARAVGVYNTVWTPAGEKLDAGGKAGK
jgi:hypothetical protein